MGTSPWEPLLGNLYLGTSIREPGGMGFGAAPLCSETFTMAEDPSSLRCWGKMSAYMLKKIAKIKGPDNPTCVAICVWKAEV